MGSLFSKTKSLQDLNAIEMLIADHERVSSLFKSYKDLEHDDSPELIDIVTHACLELMVHSKLEQEIFYPAVRAKADDETKELLAEAEIEHHTIVELVEKLAMQQLDKEIYKANFKVVSEYVEHHVKEEEEELFPKVKGLDLDLDALAEKMRARQTHLVDEIASDPNIGYAPPGFVTQPKGSQPSAPLSYGSFEGFL